MGRTPHSADPRPVAQRLAAVRSGLAAHKLDGFLLGQEDEYLNEYPPPCGRRLAWLTGFTGSAGLLVLLHERSVLFVDSRYALQAAAQAPEFERDCQDFRVWAGIMGEKESQYVPTQGAGDPG